MRGRPKGPEKVVFKKRVTPDEFKVLTSCWEGMALAVSANPSPSYGEWGSEPPIYPEATSKEEFKAAMGLVAEGIKKNVRRVDNPNAALLDDIDRLTRENEELEREFEEFRKITPEGYNSYWKVRCLKAEEYARNLNS